MRQGFDFKPKINDYKGLEESKEDRWNRLLDNKIEKKKQNEQIKQEKEKKEITENCTFHPEINQDFQVKNEEKLNLLSMYVKYNYYYIKIIFDKHFFFHCMLNISYKPLKNYPIGRLKKDCIEKEWK